MKAKLLMVLCIVGIFSFMSQSVSAQLTEENLDIQSHWDVEFGPVSLEPDYLTATLSHADKTISGMFTANYGKVVFQIVNKSGEVCLQEEVSAVYNGTYRLNLTGLNAGDYRLKCYIPGAPLQIADFKLYN